MKTAIFPGSFDPVHLGHIALAQTAADLLQIDRVIFVPSGVSPNKRHQQRTPGEQRYQWVDTALKTLADPRLTVSDVESRYTVPTYTFETIQTLGAGIPKESLFLLVGADTAERMKRWPTYNKIRRIANIVSFGRNGAAGSIEAPQWDHSSTEIRERAQKGESVGGLVPQCLELEVEDYFKMTNDE